MMYNRPSSTSKVSCQCKFHLLLLLLLWPLLRKFRKIEDGKGSKTDIKSCKWDWMQATKLCLIERFFLILRARLALTVSRDVWEIEVQILGVHRFGLHPLCIAPHWLLCHNAELLFQVVLGNASHWSQSQPPSQLLSRTYFFASSGSVPLHLKTVSILSALGHGHLVCTVPQTNLY